MDLTTQKALMKLEKNLISELKDIKKTQIEQNDVLVRQESVLSEHIRRTELAERAIEDLRSSDSKQNNLIQQMTGGMKLVAFMFSVITAISAITAIYYHLSNH